MKTIQASYNHLIQLFFLVLLATTITRCHAPNQDTAEKIVEADSISIWIQNAENESIDLENRKQALYKAYQKNNFQRNDSVKNSNLSKIAYKGFQLKDSIFFFLKQTLRLKNYL